MENVVVITPPPIMNGTTESNVSDDDSDSIILDLHVSDDSKDALQEISEEDILNKYIADEDEEMVGKKILDNIPSDESQDQDVDTKESLEDNKPSENILDVNDQEDDFNKKTADDDKTDTTVKLDIENKDNVGDDKTINCPLTENQDNKTEYDDIDENSESNDNKDNESKENDDDDSSKTDKIDDTKDDENDKVASETNSNTNTDTNDNESTESNKKIDDENPEDQENLENQDNPENQVNQDNLECQENQDNPENQEDGDLLQVMETSFVDEPEKDETSSSSEKEENGKDELSEETTAKEDEEETSSKGDVENEEKENDNNEVEEDEELKECQNMLESMISSNDNKLDQDNEQDNDPNNDPDNDQDNDPNNDPDNDQDNIECQDKEMLDVDQNIDNDECPMDIEENNVGGVIIIDGNDLNGNESKKDDEDHAEAKMDDDDHADSKKDDDVVNAELKQKGEEDESKQKENDSIMEQNESNAKQCESVVEPANIEMLELSTIDGSVEKDETVKGSNEKNEISDIELKKPTKRQLPNDFLTVEDDAKKIKLDPAPIKSKADTSQICALNSFKEYMKEKALKNMTRAQLEEFCLQKMCECLVDKSELADLRQKVRTLEQTVEQFRRESVTIANQTRDLKIVHEKVTAALKLAKEQKNKPLVPVKITRSVGLQAVLDHHNRQNRLNGILQNGKNNWNNYSNYNNNLNNVNTVQNVTRNNVNNNNSCNNVSSTVNNGSLSNIRSPAKTQQTVIQNNKVAIPNLHRSPPQATNKQTILNKQIAQKENRQGTSPIQQQVNGKKPPETTKAVIDLTDEDEKLSKSPNKAIRTNGHPQKSASLVTAPTGTKVMVIPSTVLTRQVMLKVNPSLVTKSTNLTIPTSQVSLVTQSPTTPLSTTTQSLVTKINPIRPATPQQQTNSRSPVQRFRQSTSPVPPPPPDQNYVGIVTARMIPPKPHLNLTKSPCGTGIVLQWKMPYQLSMFDAIVSYQLYAYQVPKANQKTDGWGKIGDVKALELPMAVTLTQFAVGYRYYFAVRAVDSHQRMGLFSEPQTIML